jgi:exodeoxyribonuclease III
MRVATWNINGLRARQDFVRLWLEARKPDVVGLQELKVTDDEFPLDVFDALGYHAATYGQKAWNGVAVLSRHPIEVLDRGLAGEEDFGARLLRVKTGDLDFTTVYCPNGKDLGHDDFPKKLAWFDSLLRYWASRDRATPAVLCGDFNVVPAALDSWIGAAAEVDGALFHTKDERDRFAKLLELGLVDVFRAQHPDKQTFSWWDYRGGAFHRGQGLRIDLMLASTPVAQRVRAVEIDRDFRKKKEGLLPSDHAPVYADLE